MKKIKQILFSTGIILLLYSLFQIGTWYFENENNRKLQKSLQDNSHQANIPHISEDDPQIPFLQVDFSSLNDQNSETVAWIQVPNTKIDYPVVQTSDNTFYLTHNFEKKNSKAGWIFLDYRNDQELSNQNIVIYGHGRLDNSMFGSLRDYLKDDDFHENNRLIKLSTPTENRIYEIVSIYTIKPETYYLTTFFENSSKWEQFLTTITSRSIYDYGVTLKKEDQILTLSTCRDDNQNRVVVHARLIKKEIRR